MNTPWNQTSTDGEQIAKADHQEAVRLARIALTRRYGGLEQTLSGALERLNTKTLRLFAVYVLTASDDPFPVISALLPEDVIPPLRRGIIDEQGKPARIAPLGGYRHS